MSNPDEMASYADGKIHLQLPNGERVSLKPQECWSLMEQVQRLLGGQFALLNPRILRNICRGDRKFQVVVSKNNDFWNSYQSGKWEPHTFAVLDHFLTNDSTYLDIGAWVGPTLLYGAQTAKIAFGFEPDPVAFEELNSNVHANKKDTWADKLTIFNKAVANTAGWMTLGNRGGGGDSESSFLFATEATSWRVETVILDDFCRQKQISGRVFVKMDIEGGEYELVPSLQPFFQRHDADFYLSLHPNFLKRHLRNGKDRKTGRISRRMAFFSKHKALLDALPFKNIYSRSGGLLRPLALKYDALVNGRFPGEIVATNRTWVSP